MLCCSRCFVSPRRRCARNAACRDGLLGAWSSSRCFIKNNVMHPAMMKKSLRFIRRKYRSKFMTISFTFLISGIRLNFEQMKSVIYDVPHQTLQRDLASVNCEYTISGKDSKNCYFVAVPWKAENAYYGYLIFYSRNCIDNAEIDYSEQCYGCVYAVRCYNCQNCIEVDDCLDCYYLYDSRNSSNCFMSSNLRNAKYVFRNQQLSKNVYEQKIKEINFGSRMVREELWKEFEALMESAIHRNVFSNNTQNSVGDMLENCRNCYMAFRSTGGASDNARYIWSFLDAKDVMDIYGTTNSERLYDGAAN